MTTTIKDLGEIELLNRLKKYMSYGQIDDDVAEINTKNKSLLINTDLLVEKIHFSDEISNAKDSLNLFNEILVHIYELLNSSDNLSYLYF